MKDLRGRTWDGGYRFRSFDVLKTDVQFEYEKGEKSGNVSAVWSPPSDVFVGEMAEMKIGSGYGLNGSIVSGVKQGWRYTRVIDPKNRDKRGASELCRRKMWELGSEVMEMLVEDDDGDGEGSREFDALGDAFGKSEYVDLKESAALEKRREVKRDVREVLAPKGWVRNLRDEGWGLHSDSDGRADVDTR